MRGIEAALKILAADANSGQFATEALRKLADREKMKAPDISLASSLVYIVMRRKELWEKIAGDYLRAKEKLPAQVYMAVIMGTGGLLELRRFSGGVLINGIVETLKHDKAAAKYASLVNAVLHKVIESVKAKPEKFSRSPSPEARAMWAGVPVWTLPAWSKTWSTSEMFGIFAMMDQPSYSSLRVSPGKSKIAASSTDKEHEKVLEFDDSSLKVAVLGVSEKHKKTLKVENSSLKVPTFRTNEHEKVLEGEDSSLKMTVFDINEGREKAFEVENSTFKTATFRKNKHEKVLDSGNSTSSIATSGKIEEFTNILESGNFHFHVSELSGAINLNQSVLPANVPGFKEGICTVQSESSILAASLVKKFYSGKSLILDMCSGRGIKAAQVLQENESAKLECWELSERRSNSAEHELKRLGVISRAVLKVGDALKLEPSEIPGFIMLDVPCTCSGTWNRKPESKWRLDWKKFDAITKTQKLLLERAVNLCESGGYILYITCSLFKQENENVIAEVISQHPECAEISSLIEWNGSCFKHGRPYGIYILPVNSWLDGFYCSLILKHKRRSQFGKT